MIEFTSQELIAMQKDIIVLEALIDYHDVQTTMAWAAGYDQSVRSHRARQQELQAEIDLIKASH